MSVRVDPSFIPEIGKYGAFDISACFNCGNCTAICPLSTETESFPRRMIRYAQLGIRGRLLASRELWLCYYCGECSDTCPREAEPGEFMASVRRYAIAHYDITGLARRVYTSTLFSVALLLVLALLLTLVFLSRQGPASGQSLALFEFVPATLIHDVGIAVLSLLFLVGLVNVVNMVRKLAGAEAGPSPAPPGRSLSWREWLTAAVGIVIREVLGHRRYRDCDEEKQPPWFLKPWFLHGSMAWGFLGLLAATALDWVLDLTGIKPTGTMVPIWYPVRLLGTVAGVFLVYGTTVVIAKRIIKSDKPSSHSLLSDWILLGMLWLAGVSGFAVELALYLPPPQNWAYWIFLGHVVVSMELLLVAPFTKFAHVFYRTVALVVHDLKAIAASPAG
jgi:ferredoxin